MTPEEFVMVCEDYEEFQSIYDGMKGDFINVILILKKLRAQKSLYKFQENMKQGKVYCCKYYGHTFTIKEFIGVVDPREKVDINTITVTSAELITPEIEVDVYNKLNEPLIKKIPYDGIFEYIDPKTINPQEYEF